MRTRTVGSLQNGRIGRVEQILLELCQAADGETSAFSSSKVEENDGTAKALGTNAPCAGRKSTLSGRKLFGSLFYSFNSYFPKGLGSRSELFFSFL